MFGSVAENSRQRRGEFSATPQAMLSDGRVGRRADF
jgi:hypothetical protein